MPINFQNKSLEQVIDEVDTLFPKESKESRSMLKQWLLRALHFEQAVYNARVAFANAEIEVDAGEAK